jgi:lysophospholipase L1-like esterase
MDRVRRRATQSPRTVRNSVGAALAGAEGRKEGAAYQELTMRPLALLIAAAVAGCSPTHRAGDDMPADDTPADDTGPEPDAGTTPVPDGPTAARPIDALDQPALVIVVGDSIAAGYNASNNNAPGGGGYARRVANALGGAGGTQLRDLAESGANSDEAAARVAGASLPSVAGDVLVLVNVGGNDFNDSIEVMLSPAATAAAAANLRANLADIVTTLRARYEDASAGAAVVFAIDTIHDPTDGLGTIPPQYDDGFCETIQNPLFTPELRAQALANLGTMNAAIAAEAAAQDGVLVDVHGAFLGHGMNATGADKWLANDCAHPTTDGHDHLHQIVWTALVTPAS